MYSTVMLTVIKQEQPCLCKRERATALHVWKPTANKSRLIDLSNWHWVRLIYIRQIAPPSRVDAAVWVAECEYFEEGIQVWRPRTENSLNVGGRNMNRWKLRLMLKVSYAGCFSLSQLFSAQFRLEKCVSASRSPKSPKKSINPLL